MDSNILRRKTVHSSGFDIVFLLVFAALILGALAFWLFAAEYCVDIMYSLGRGGAVLACAACAMVLFTVSASVMLPTAVAALWLVLGGGVGALLTCLSFGCEILSAEFFKSALMEFVYIYAMLYAACNVIKFSPRVRALVENDKHLNSGLFCLSIAPLIFLAIVFIIAFI